MWKSTEGHSVGVHKPTAITNIVELAEPSDFAPHSNFLPLPFGFLNDLNHPTIGAICRKIRNSQKLAQKLQTDMHFEVTRRINLSIQILIERYGIPPHFMID